MLDKKSQQVELLQTEKQSTSDELKATLGQLDLETQRSRDFEVKVKDVEVRIQEVKDEYEEKEAEYKSKVRLISLAFIQNSFCSA